jgi:cytochrome c oxidase assembly factor CtaG
MHASLTMLLHAGVPLHHWWQGWDWSPAIVLPLAASGILYARGVRALWRDHRGRTVQRWQVWSFGVGLVVAALALVSPLHALSEQLFLAHMLQHELLMAVAAPLLVLGWPLVPSLWGFPRSTRQRVGAFVRHPAIHATTHSLGSPLGAFALHGITIWVWHAPVLFQATLESEVVHALQHVSFLGTALVFWWSVLHARYTGYGLAVLLLFATTLHTGALGALLTFSRTLWYPVYASSAASWGLTPLEDQQLAGLLMWIPASVAYLAAALWLFAGWLRESDRRVRYVQAPDGEPVR